MFLLLCSFAAAQETQLTLDPQVADAAGIDESTLQSSFGDALDGAFHTQALDGFTGEMASANLLSTRGMGVDYASAMQRFALGGSLGSATSSGKFSFGGGDSPVPESGFAFQMMVMAGLNLGVLAQDDSPARRFRVYGNAMKAGTRRGAISGEFFNWGAHLQINMIKRRGDKAAEWGGIDLTSGYESSSYTLTLAETYPLDFGGGIWDATGTYSLAANGRTIPVELSTSLRIVMVSVYVGGAFDTNLVAAADNTIRLDGPMTVDIGGRDETLGTANVSYGASGTSAMFTPRAFGGAQIDITLVKVYGQLATTFDGSIGGHFGVRLVL